MVNTRILEQRLGWRSGEDGEETAPPSRAHPHTPVLQGRVNRSSRGLPMRGPRRAAVDDAWSSLSYVDSSLAELVERNATTPKIDRNTPTGTVMDSLRSQLMRVIRDNGWRRIGITSAERGAGRSFVSVGLAASFNRLEAMRVLLIDADLESPGLADILGIDAAGNLEMALTGEHEPVEYMHRIGADLAAVLNDTSVPAAGDLMHSPEAILSLRAMIDLVEPDIAILDMPPLLGDQTASALLPQLDAVLLVSDGMRTKAKDIEECERILNGQVPLLGVVLNKSEDRETRSNTRRRH